MPRLWATNLQQVEFNLLSVFQSKVYFLSICGGEFLCVPQTFLFSFPWVLGQFRQCLELALCSEVTPEGHKRLYRTLGIESCSNSYTANALPAVPFFWPHPFFSPFPFLISTSSAVLKDLGRPHHHQFPCKTCPCYVWWLGSQVWPCLVLKITSTSPGRAWAAVQIQKCHLGPRSQSTCNPNSLVPIWLAGSSVHLWSMNSRTHPEGCLSSLCSCSLYPLACVKRLICALSIGDR